VADTPAPPDRSSSRVGEAKDAAQQVKAGASSIGDTLGELLALVVAYAKQETVDPLKSLLRFVLWGVIGAVCMGIGGFLIVLAAIRALQFEAAPHLNGDLSWVPYLAGMAVAAIGVVLAVSRIGKTSKADRP
jgi:sugar phosphate permease